MAQIVNMPKLGFDMAEGTLVRWVINEGDHVIKGAVLAEIETDKATVEVESSASGVVLQLIVDQGTMVPVNTPIAIVGSGPAPRGSGPCASTVPPGSSTITPEGTAAIRSAAALVGRAVPARALAVRVPGRVVIDRCLGPTAHSLRRRRFPGDSASAARTRRP